MIALNVHSAELINFVKECLNEEHLGNPTNGLATTNCWQGSIGKQNGNIPHQKLQIIQRMGATEILNET